MAMDFFAAQDHARRNTRWLVLWFVLLLLGLVLLTDALLVGYLLTNTEPSKAQPSVDWWVFFRQHSGQIGACSAVVFLGVSCAVLVRQSQLSDGGAAVATMLGGELLDDRILQSERFAARHEISSVKLAQAVNIVEEMAIAAGLPRPPVYIVPSDGINAFAAGYHSDDAVIGLTIGAIKQLSRDELQGVVAHEFSHILNGDMRLNIRLMAMIFGLTCVYELGEFLVRMRSSSSKDGVPLFAVGAGLMLIGGIGVLFASLLRAAVSRQREYLADSSAVQFTRNSAGIAGALYKIGQLGSQVSMAQAQEVGHFFLSDVRLTSFSFSSWWASHPPLEARIQALVPNWQPGQPLTSALAARSSTPTSSPDASIDATANANTDPRAHKAATVLVGAAALAGSRATPSIVANADANHPQESMAAAPWQAAMHTRLTALVAVGSAYHLDPALERSCAQLHAELMQLDTNRHALLRSPAGAEALVYAVICGETMSDSQELAIKTASVSAVWQAVVSWRQLMPHTSLLVQLMLLQVATPILREMSAPRRRSLLERVHRLMIDDGLVNDAESLVWLWLSHQLDASTTASTELPLAEARAPVAHLMAVAAKISRCSAWQPLASAALGTETTSWVWPDAATVTPRQLADYLPTLLRLRPTAKQRVWQALTAITLADTYLTVHELSLLHLYGLLLNLPLQPPQR